MKMEKTFRDELPHLYGYPWYKWAREFFESRSSVSLLCAANQISKSSTQIRKCIDWATDTSKWGELWSTPPRQFWYLYPTLDVATIEFQKKWLPEFMPRGGQAKTSEYGYQVEKQRGQIKAIHFNTGVSVYFKAYSQDVQHLQTGTVHAIFADEELPVALWDELSLRLAAVGGYFNMVFTATLNQDFWRRCIEPSTREQEVMPEAFKKQVSMYECLEYEDGSPTPWTVEKIRQIEMRCKSEAEKQRRVHGRFVTEEGRIFQGFDSGKHFKAPLERVVPAGWHVYSGVDIGSGGKDNHPASVVFIAVRPDHRMGYVVRCWRGDGVPTTNGDIVNKYVELRGRMKPVVQAYDHAAKDFGTIQGRMGLGFVKAEKSHEIGEGIVNTLFKNDMLFIIDDDEGRKLGGELSTLMHSTPKNKRKDDLADALRYAATQVPWDFEAIGVDVEAPKEVVPRQMSREEQLAMEIDERRGIYRDEGKGKFDGWGELEMEFEDWNEQYG